MKHKFSEKENNKIDVRLEDDHLELVSKLYARDKFSRTLFVNFDFAVDQIIVEL